jgi:hypothetical protein
MQERKLLIAPRNKCFGAYQFIDVVADYFLKFAINIDEFCIMYD